MYTWKIPSGSKFHSHPFCQPSLIFVLSLKTPGSQGLDQLDRPLSPPGWVSIGDQWARGFFSGYELWLTAQLLICLKNGVILHQSGEISGHFCRTPHRMTLHTIGPERYAWWLKYAKAKTCWNHGFPTSNLHSQKWVLHRIMTVSRARHTFRVQLYHIHLAGIIAVDSLVPETEHDAVSLVNLWQEFPTDCRYVC